MAELWKQIAIAPLGDHPYHLVEGDICYYAHDYYCGQGYKAGDGNDFISNFKKDVSRRGRPEWKHKERVILWFATVLAKSIPAGAVIVPATTSKADDDPAYDDRLVQVVTKAAQLNPELIVQRPAKVVESKESSHLGGNRNPESIRANLQWIGFDIAPPEWLYLVDDVITTGAHFLAFKRILQENHPTVQVAGIFGAKANWSCPAA